MRSATKMIIAAVAAVTLAPATSAVAATHAPASPAHKAAQPVVTALAWTGARTVNDNAADVVLKYRVQVKHFATKSHKHYTTPVAPTVTVTFTPKGGTAGAPTTLPAPRLVGKSGIVANWRGTFTVTKASPAGTYCLAVTSPTSSAIPKGLKKLACVTVVNTPPAS